MDGRLIDRGRHDPRPAGADRRRQPLGAGRRRKALGKGKAGKLVCAVPAQRRRASRDSNVAHHYDLGNELYELFLDDDLQYSCAYFTDPSNSLEQAQADKKAHIAAKLDLKPGSACSTSAAAGAAWRSTCTRSPASTCSASRYPRSSSRSPAQRAEDAGVVRPCEVRADRLSPCSRDRSTGSFRSACSSMSAPRITTNSSPSAASC